MMQVVDIIRAKRDGQRIDPEALTWLIEGYTAGRVPDYQISAFLMAVVFQGMDTDELAAWTEAMLRSGQVLDMSDISGPKVDKHSTGGVGDKVSIILAPLAVAAGLKVPMISGRGLGHTGGTTDKLETIPGFDMLVDTDRFRELVRDVGSGLITQTGQIAPADKKLYALRDVTGTVRCIPLIASSIMSKKMAEGIDALVLDIKVGNGAFMREVSEARELARTMIGIGRKMDRAVRAVLTDMNQPLGRAVGNALEVVECIEIMQTGTGPEDLIEVTLELTAHMVELGGKLEEGESIEACKQRLRGLIEDGSALDAFREIVRAQGGDVRVCEVPGEVLAHADHMTDFVAERDGVIGQMDTIEIGMACVELGGGRLTKEDVIDPGVGMMMHKRLGDTVQEGRCDRHDSPQRQGAPRRVPAPYDARRDDRGRGRRRRDSTADYRSDRIVPQGRRERRPRSRTDDESFLIDREPETIVVDSARRAE